jgi:glycosyltransferase involved in cell wall biosynthesis
MKKQSNESVSIAAFVSVVLPVYNFPVYIDAAVKSILDQMFKSFEFIIIDVGSTNNTPEIIRTFTDPRIRFIQQENQGLVAMLNWGNKITGGKYIARQDQDVYLCRKALQNRLNFLNHTLGTSLPHLVYFLGLWQRY